MNTIVGSDACKQVPAYLCKYVHCDSLSELGVLRGRLAAMTRRAEGLQVIEVVVATV